MRASLPVHLSRLADRREGTRQAAAAALQRIDPEWAQRPEAVARIAELAVAATSMDAGVRTAALQHLDAIDPDWPRNEAARAAVLELTRALKDRIFRREKEAVAGMLGRMPVDWIKGPVTELIATGDHETRDVIGALLERLDLQGDDPESGAAVALLVEDLARTPVDLSLTRDTIDKLGNLGDKAAIGPLLKKAGCRHVELRPLIVDVLDQIDLDWAQSPEATALVPGMLHDLESALTHSTRVRFAVEMLGAMRVPEAVAPLLARLIENPLGLEPQLLVALESVDPEWTARPEARKAIPVLRRQSSEHAERALERLGAD